jgi:hypothetical protein
MDVRKEFEEFKEFEESFGVWRSACRRSAFVLVLVLFAEKACQPN